MTSLFKILTSGLLVVGLVIAAGGVLPTAATAADGDGERGGEGGFQPQTQREAALYRMIQQLQQEVAGLRRVVEARRREGQAGEGRDREGDARHDGDARREGDAREADRPRVSEADLNKHGRQFRTYDKNGNGSVSFEERLAMKNYEVTGARLLNEKLYHLAEDTNRDGGISLAEFAAARSRRGGQSWRQAQLLSIQGEESSITVESRGGEGTTAGGRQTLRVEPKAVISLRGKETKLGNLKPGQPVFLFMSHDERSAIGVTQR